MQLKTPSSAERLNEKHAIIIFGAVDEAPLFPVPNLCATTVLPTTQAAVAALRSLCPELAQVYTETKTKESTGFLNGFSNS